MPLYDFKCEKCGEKQEVLKKSSQDLQVCTCGYIMVKQVGKVSFELKGSCWEKDGYN